MVSMIKLDIFNLVMLSYSVDDRIGVLSGTNYDEEFMINHKQSDRQLYSFIQVSFNYCKCQLNLFNA